MMPLEILTACESDLPDILALQRLAFQETARRYNDFKIPSLLQTLDELTEESKSFVILKAVVENIIVGSVRACERDDYCYIGRLIVHPDFRNKGIGRRLMAAIESRFDVQRYELMTGNLDEKNRALYSKLGYTVFKTEKISDNVQLIHMEKIK